jgi:lysyl oxidase
VGARSPSRIRLATGVAAISAAAIAALLTVSSARVSADPADLPPDLVTLAIQQDDLLLLREGERTVLRFSNEVGNHGNGPLEVFPSPGSLGCDGDADPYNDRDASQRVFADSNGNGGFERGIDGVAYERLFGCMRYHPAHNHWHVLDFASYELRREPTGKLFVRSRKVGFCLSDARLAFPSALTPPAATYPIGPPGAVGCDATATQGISPGWADIYLFALPGQELEVTGLPRGHYCLITRADPNGLLDELDEDNNVRRARLVLRPEKPTVRKLDGPCRV